MALARHMAMNWTAVKETNKKSSKRFECLVVNTMLYRNSTILTRLT